MSRNAFFACLILVSGILVVAAPVPAAAKKKIGGKTGPAQGTVEKALRAEVAGQVDRRGELAETLKQHPDSAAARWQAGFVKDGDSWRPFDEPTAATSESERLKDYRVRRDDAPRTFAGQLDLANWCRKQGMKDQERAHLSGALFLAPEVDQPLLLQRLGYQLVGGQWFSREDLAAWQHLNRRIEGAVQKWGSRLETIAERIDGSGRQHDVAVASLVKLTEPDVIPAMQYVLSGRNEACAEAAIAALGKADTSEATVALAQTAAFSKWPEVRQRATSLLKTRRFEDFVPTLTRLLASHVSVGVASTQLVVFLDRPYLGGGGGRAWLVLLVNYVIARETDDQFQATVLHSTDFRLNGLLQGSFGSFVSIDSGLRILPGAGGNISSELATARRKNDGARAEDATDLVRVKRIEDIDERTDELNARVINVLAGATGRPADAEPAVWWKWWADYADVQQTSNKPVVVVSEDSEIVGDPRITLPRISCFAAGTPVWTESGARAIETIKVGDRVLAKDIESGELAYKPVLQTTIRPPKELTTLRFGDETIVCTGGHRFWSSGSGWIKARDLEPQTLLHTVTGNTPVWSAKKGNTAETYNLVVADFHTYFVGKTGVLCQDLLIPHSTNNVVPGLPRAQAVAQK